MPDELDAGSGKLQSIIDHTPWCLLRKTNKSIMFFFRTGKSLPFSRQAIVKNVFLITLLFSYHFTAQKNHLQFKKLQAFLEFFVYTIDPGQKPEHRYYQSSPVNQPDHQTHQLSFYQSMRPAGNCIHQTCPPFYAPGGTPESSNRRSKLTNLLYSFTNASETFPTGPLRCLAMIISMMFLFSASWS
jgi:hypothetical protein